MCSSMAPMAAGPAAITTFITLLFTLSILKAVAGVGVGVNYGQIANNLPPPRQVAQFIAQSTVIDRVKLFDADPAVIQAFAGTGVAVDIAVSNDLILNLTGLHFARHWVQSTILPYASSVDIHRILVGNEVASTARPPVVAGLVPAMQNLHTALAGASLHRRIKISSPHSLAILAASDPPSSGRFRSGYDATVMVPLLSFLRATSSAFMVNAYPFFGFTPATLDYALFRPNRGAVDRDTGLVYTNMLDGQLDAVYSAMKRLGFGDVDIAVAETGWPSAGDPGEVGVDVANARDYNKNLIRHLASSIGTPLMPNRTFEAYIFALFNEDLKPGPTSERNFGLFHPDMTPVYDIGILRNGARQQPPAISTAPPENPAEPGGKRWCVPGANADDKSLQGNIDFACSQGIDCRPIQPGGACFLPNTVRAHAAYAMNEYYRAFGQNPFDCFFGETGSVTSMDPSYGNCKYSS